MSELTRQRHEERMAERRRGAGGRAVTQTFGFDLPLIVATPPEIRTKRVAEKFAALAVEEPAEEDVPMIEEPQRRRSGRLSRGGSVLSTASAQDIDMPDSDGSLRKRRKIDTSSPARSVSSRRSVSVVIDPRPDLISSVLPDKISSDVGLESAVAGLALKTPMLRSTPKISPRPASLAPEPSVMLSSPSPLPPRNPEQIVPSSVSPEPLQFTSEAPEGVAITPEPAGAVEDLVDDSPLALAQLSKASGLRAARRSKPAIAAVTPIPRGKRRRQPSPDKFLTPEKPPTPEPEIEENTAEEEEQSVQEKRPATPPADEEVAAAKPAGRRRGRKPKAKKQSEEIPFQDSPIQKDMDEAVLSDVEPEPMDEEEDGTGESRARRVEEEVDDEEEEYVQDPDEEFEEENEGEDDFDANQAGSSTRPRKQGAKAPRRPRQPGKSRLRDENGEPKETLDITVYRIPKSGELNLKFPKQPNNIHIASEFILSNLDAQLTKLSHRKAEEKNREEKARMKICEKVITTFSSALENKFIEMASKADNIKMKGAELRRIQKEKASLRDELMQLRESREDIARQIDAVRKKHEEVSTKSHKQEYIHDTLQYLGTILEQEGAKSAAVPAEERAPTTVGLDALLNSVTQDLCSSDDPASGIGGKGILDQVKEMNRFLEAATEALRRGR